MEGTHILLNSTCDQSKKGRGDFFNFRNGSSWKLKPGAPEKFWNDYLDLLNDLSNSENETESEGETIYSEPEPELEGEEEISIGESGKDQNHAYPFVAVFNFVFRPTTKTEDIFDDGFHMSVINIYSRLLRYYFIDPDIKCMVLESKRMVGIKDKDHYQVVFHFPLLRLEAKYHSLIHREAIRDFMEENILTNFKRQPIAGWEEIIDMRFYDKPYPLFGSCTKEMSPVTFYSFYDVTESEGVTKIDLYGHFRFKDHKHVSILGMSIEEFPNESEMEESDYLYYLPYFLSLNFHPAITQPRPEISKLTNKDEKKAFTEDSEEGMCLYFMEHLNENRAKSYSSWLDVGKALYFHFENVGFNYWIKFTHKISALELKKERLGKAMDLYHNHIPHCTPKTVRTLAYFLSMDDPIEYQSFRDRWISDAFKFLVATKTEMDYAIVGYRLGWLKYVYCPKALQWYYFDNHRWNVDRDNLNIKRHFQYDLRKMIEVFRKDLVQESYDMGMERTQSKDEKENQIKICCRINEIFGNHTKANNAVNSSKTWFAYPGFHFSDVMDTNKDLLGVRNGVLETTEEGCSFRNGMPEDFLTQTTKAKYDEALTWESEMVKKTLDYISVMFHTVALINYIWRIFSYLLKGGNSEKKLFIFWGPRGDNGKSTLCKLLDCTFGSYYNTVNTSIITSQRKEMKNSKAADPELASCKFSRIVTCLECKKGEVVDGGRTKQITGGDSVRARNLNENGGPFEPQFKLFVFTNTVPPAENIEEPQKNRFCIIPVMTIWNESAPESKEEQVKNRHYPVDRDFDSKEIPKMANAFLWICVKRYRNFLRYGLRREIPIEITEACNNYWNEIDIHHQFVKQNLEKDENFAVKNDAVYKRYKTWLTQSYPRTPMDNITEFSKNIDYQLNDVRNADNCWEGWNLVKRGDLNFDINE